MMNMLFGLHTFLDFGAECSCFVVIADVGSVPKIDEGSLHVDQRCPNGTQKGLNLAVLMIR